MLLCTLIFLPGFSITTCLLPVVAIHKISQSTCDETRETWGSQLIQHVDKCKNRVNFTKSFLLVIFILWYFEILPLLLGGGFQYLKIALCIHQHKCIFSLFEKIYFTHFKIFSYNHWSEGIIMYSHNGMLIWWLVIYFTY